MALNELTFTLAQINPVVGALAGNANKILDIWKNANSHLIVFPELCITGYPPEDLVLKPAFIRHVEETVADIQKKSAGFKAAAAISAPWIIDGRVKNALLVIHAGHILHVQAKHHLPNYGVFDEMRVFTPGELPEAIELLNHKIGFMICEDMWFTDVSHNLKRTGAELLISLNASPYTVQKSHNRIHHAKMRTQETNLPLIFVNQVGGQDELVFDGASFVMNQKGEITTRSKAFDEDILTTTLAARSVLQTPPSEENALIYKALTLGVKDYVKKNGFPGILIGLSGGVDSALAASIACDAIGAQNVHCVMMPSPYTSQDSLDDAALLAKNLGCTYETIPIQNAMEAFETAIDNLNGLAHENMQSRIRGLILMALSNTYGKMVLTTGNKSEMAVGYATLYGDMCGGYNALKDIYKTKVYALCHWRNAQDQIIPERILTRAPSAELRDDQTDQDSLPPYDILDAILECLIEKNMGIEEVAAVGHNRGTVEHVQKLLYRAEYKRYQAAPGTVITERAFGRDRRYPMTNKYP